MIERQITLAMFLALSGAQPAFSACGDNGGPGYRNQSGKCVGWEALAGQCGNPPSTKCTPENVAAGSEDAAAKGQLSGRFWITHMQPRRPQGLRARSATRPFLEWPSIGMIAAANLNLYED